MRKIFLVDDEIIVREGIRQCIDWTHEGFEYCGDASDGEMALPLIEQHCPDIVITDIKMPFMDGLELSRILKEKMPDVKIIILSGHDEFEYAREALKIQINEYCLKPLSAIDLLEVLHKVSAKIDQEETERKLLSDLKNQAMQTVTFTREKFLIALCEGRYSTAKAIKKALDLDIALVANVYYTLVLQYATKEMSAVEELLNQYPHIRFNKSSNEIVFIMKGESRTDLEWQASSVRDRLVEITKLYPDYSLNFSMGKVQDRIQGIPLSFAEAEQEKSYNLIYKYSLELNGDDEKNESHRFDRKDLTSFLKLGNKDGIVDFCLSYSAYLKDSKIHTPFYFYYFLMDFTTTIKLYIKEVDKDYLTILDTMKSLELTVKEINHYRLVVDYMETMLTIIFEAREHSISKYSRTIEKTKEFIIRNHHDSQLSLQTLAKQVNVSASYLSHMFSQETGQTLIEFLTMIRIERAKELLKTTDDKTYEIAYKVGFSDSHYFCHLFKKWTGMTTKKFKSQDQKVIL